MIKPFIATILSSMLVVYIFYPLYRRLELRINHPNISAILCTILVFFIIAVPLVIFISSFSSDAASFYISVKDVVGDHSENSMITRANEFFGPMLSSPQIRTQIDSTLTTIASSIMEYSSRVILSLPSILLNLVIFAFLLFSFFRDGDRLMKRLYNSLPLGRNFKTELKKQTGDVLFATIYGNVVIALVQGLIGAATFALLGIVSPMLWGFIIFILALLPFIGAGLVWVPAFIMQLMFYMNGSGRIFIWKAAGLLAAGIIMSTIDIFLKPKVIGKRARLHPALIVLGIFGGVAFMGFIGFFLGPVILALFMSFLKVYESDKDEIIS